MEDGYDFVTFGNGEESSEEDADVIVRLTGEAKLRTVTSSGSFMWINVASDRTGLAKGFLLHISQVNDVQAICNETEFDCGEGFCLDADAKCDGFQDCPNQQEENNCAYVTCPTSYLCEDSDTSNVSMCVALSQVCDGTMDCPQGDDEIRCDIKRCPDDCDCGFSETNDLQIVCNDGWTGDHLRNLPQISSTIHLTEGNITILRPGLFKAFFQVEALSLALNHIFDIQLRAFDGLGTITWLDLSYNGFLTLKRNMFEELQLLKDLFLVNVPLLSIENSAFVGLTHLERLVLVRGTDVVSDLVYTNDAFRGIEKLDVLYGDDHRMCCAFNHLSECVTLEPLPPLFNCGSLMQNAALRVAMWILGVSAVVGNFLVAIVRLKEKTESDTQLKQRLFISNLALSDLLMGIYMLILASADLYYGEDYYIFSDRWRTGLVCRIAGFIGLFSSEASVFFITLISVDRFLSVVFPLSQVKLRSKSSKMAVISLWLISFVVSIVPIVLAGPDSDFYDLSDVCIGLPLITRPARYNFEASGVANQVTFDLPVAEDSKPAWYFSIVIFLGINLVCFLVIFLCYVAIFVSVKRSRKSAGRKESLNEEMKMAIKMAAVVGTDFICWFPVIMMGVLSQTGAVVIPLDAYVWSVVFVLPINSSLNPYLYTLATMISDHRAKSQKRKMQGGSKSSSKSTKATGSTRTNSGQI
ncbi:lutropin-choriogonadotropic hormone receptor-like [Amphiura filiformis]|uniref:lutropin-choriogonadotropic hormone receptor-like n=1 Tax=Amphiura filiformis TaxID=82378 RepID=UPI003B20BB3C